MRRYSEIPNTPTPMTRGSELKVGTLLTIPNTGRAILRYIGPVEGKSGKFAGFELLGESAVLGKNSGEVDGVEYFKTIQPGAGLFMAYDKLLATLEGIESPRSGRLSMAGPPGGVRFNQTPSRQSSRQSQAPHSTKRQTVTTRSHNSTPPLPTVPGSSPRSSPAEREIQRLLNTKIVIENERDNLLRETEELKRQLRGAHDRLDENDDMLRQLQSSYDEAQEKLERASERVALAESKLVKQRRVYEEQRKELLEVIDQVEAQVNDNEQLYIGELKKLQEELQQKQEIIDGVQSKLKNLENLYEKQKGTIKEVGDEHLDSLHSEIQNLKLTNLTQAQAIEQLRADVKEKEEKLISLSKESLELKEAHITDKSNMDVQLKEQKYAVERLQLDVGVKENELIDLREELRVLKGRTDDVTRNISGAGDVDTLKSKHEIQIKELELRINELTQKLDTSVSEDKLQELEFKLEKKEKMIADLRSELLTITSSKADDNSSHEKMETLRKEIDSLKTQLAESTARTETLQYELEALRSQQDAMKKLENELSSRDLKLKECESLMGEKDILLNEHSEKLAVLEKTSEELMNSLNEKENEITKVQQQAKELSESLDKALSEKTQLEAISLKTKELEDTLQSKENEIQSLKTQMEDWREKQKDNGTETDHSCEPEKSSESPELEEKILEIEILKEELALLKSIDAQKEVESLKDELMSLKKLNRYTTNRELLEQIQLLQKELASRPTTDEVQQLRSELELIEQLRRVESKSKDKEIYHLKEQVYGRVSGQSTAPATPRVNNDSLQLSSRKKSHSKMNSTASRSSPTLSPISMNRPPVISQVVDGALQVYVPESKQDPGNGRKQWCGLCERTGHDSIDCPYENDIF